MYKSVVKVNKKIINNRKKTLMQSEDQTLPKNKIISEIKLQNSSILKKFRQKNDTHVGDSENAISISSNLDYDAVGHQPYQYKMRVSEPEFDIQKSMLVKLG